MTQIHADTPIFWYFTVAFLAMFATVCIIVGLAAAAVRGEVKE